MANKLFEEREACNFYRSYWETAQLLSDKDRLEYYDSIINAQFTGEVNEPTGKMSLLAFRGQFHSLKKQINGFIKGKETYPNGNPTKGKDKGKGKEVQGQEKGQGKDKPEKNSSSPNVEQFLSWFNQAKQRYKGEIGKFRVLTKTDINNLKQLKKGYGIADFEKAFAAMCASQWANETNNLTPSHFLRLDNFNRYLSQTNEKPKHNPYG